MCRESYTHQQEAKQDFQRFFRSLESFSVEEAKHLPVQEIVRHWYQEFQQYDIVSINVFQEHLQQYVAQKNHSPLVSESVTYFIDTFLY